AASLVGTSAPPALIGSTIGAAVAVLPGDLAERTMLGDCGANALGAALGCTAAAAGHRGVRVGGLALVVSLTMLSERVSFSTLIARWPPLAAFDALGRRAHDVAGPSGVPSLASARGC
ncbi:MAG: hypothetical protein LC749_03410, partial [Actinobacteria bacterium]|nr:hypothetical protein [Actinomycetota bacterium]